MVYQLVSSHKRKDGDAQRLYRYVIYKHRYEMSLSTLLDVSLKEAREDII